MGIRAVKYRDFAALSQQAADADVPLTAVNLDVRVRASRSSAVLTRAGEEYGAT